MCKGRGAFYTPKAAKQVDKQQTWQIIGERRALFHFCMQNMWQSSKV